LKKGHTVIGEEEDALEALNLMDSSHPISLESGTGSCSSLREFRLGYVDRPLLGAEVVSRTSGRIEMRLQTPAPQMSIAEFKAALKRHGFRVVRTKIEDGMGKCPGVRWSAALRGRTIGYNKTLAKVIAARNAELARSGIEENTTDPE
jgi:hypothetical protein